MIWALCWTIWALLVAIAYGYFYLTYKDGVVDNLAENLLALAIVVVLFIWTVKVFTDLFTGHDWLFL